jgi:hypothetical protein
MTLYSGGALAAASATQCLAYAVNNTKALPVDSSGLDTYVRVRLWVVGSGSKLSCWVKGDDLVPKAGRTKFLPNGSWMLVKPPTGTGGTGGTYEGKSVGYVSTVTPAQDGAPAQTGNYRAIRVDASGNIVGVVNDNQAAVGYGLPGTCWTSFVAGP